MSPMIKPSHKGLLHKKLGIPQGEKIPAARIASAKKSKSPALREEATFAQNFGRKRGKGKRLGVGRGGSKDDSRGHPDSHAAFEKLGHDGDGC